MKKWICYGGGVASMLGCLLGCLLVASGLEVYTGWAEAACFAGALALLALSVVLMGLGSCAEMEEEEKEERLRKARRGAKQTAADRRKAG